MRNEQVLQLFTQLFGAARLEGGELDGSVGSARVVAVDEDGEVIFEATTAQVAWAVEGAGFAPASRS